MDPAYYPHRTGSSPSPSHHSSADHSLSRIEVDLAAVKEKVDNPSKMSKGRLSI